MRKDMLDLIQEKGERIKDKPRKTRSERKKGPPQPKENSPGATKKSRIELKNKNLAL